MINKNEIANIPQKGNIDFRERKIEKDHTALLIIDLQKGEFNSEIINKKVLTLKIVLVSLLAITALASLPILTSSGHTHFKHALEWDFMIGVLSFYMLTFFFWKKPLPHTLSGV